MRGMMSKFRLKAVLRLGIAAFVLSVGPLIIFGNKPSAEAAIDGSTHSCPDFVVDLFLFDIDIPDPAWVWVDPSDRFEEVSGVVTRSKVTHTDFPAAHDSHDQIVDILVDPGFEDLLSDINRDDPDDPRSPDKIEIEWETGILPTEKSGDGANPYFPKWAWPSEGDRVWADGHWIFDCGHGTEIDGVEHHRTELHPVRAIASMRDQVHTLPGTGNTPVRTIVTDLYIHGQGGFATEIVNCGAQIMLASEDNFCPTKLTPIDENFDFEILLPPKPFPTAVLAMFFENGPGNTVDIAPVLNPLPASGPTVVEVTVSLADTGVTPEDVYARKIYTGWVFPPSDLRHFKLTLDAMDLHEDHEQDPGDCECTFFWMNVNRSPGNEWIRLSDFATGNMNDYDDDGFFGDGIMEFSGATFDYFVADGLPVNIKANGYDQDCLDDIFGSHIFNLLSFSSCYLDVASSFNAGDNDKYRPFEVSFGPPDYGEGPNDVKNEEVDVTLPNGVIIKVHEYDLEFTIEEIPITIEDEVNLSITNSCAKDPGQSFTCTTTVDSSGPGLPIHAEVQGTITTDLDPSQYTLSSATFIVESDGFMTAEFSCDLTSSSEFTCDLGTVPIGGSATVTYTVTSDESAEFTNSVEVSTDTTLDAFGSTFFYDITPPVITLNGDNPVELIEGEAYIEAGASVTDNSGEDLSGSLVIDSSAVDTTTAGTYFVTYDVTDSSGNAAVQVIRTVIVLSPIEATEKLINEIEELVESGILNTGQGNSLTSKLDNAIMLINRNRINAACNIYSAFINETNALINSGKLSEGQGQPLIDFVQRIQTSLGCD